MVLIPQCSSKSPEQIVKPVWGSVFRAFCLEGAGSDPRMCISNKFPVEAGAGLVSVL